MLGKSIKILLAISIICIVIYSISLFNGKKPPESPETPLFASERRDRAWLIPLPYLFIKPLCNCSLFAKNFPKSWWIDTNEGETGHRVVRIRDEGDSWIIVESNYHKCQISFRRFYKDDPRITKVYK